MALGVAVGLEVAVGGTDPTEPPQAASINPTMTAAIALYFTSSGLRHSQQRSRPRHRSPSLSGGGSGRCV